MTAPDMLGQYARLLNQKESMEQRGQRVPPQLLSNISHIEMVAQQQLAPEQIAGALEHVGRLRLEQKESSRQVQDIKQFQYDRIKSDKAFESASAGITTDGTKITPEQLGEALANDGKYTAKTGKVSFPKEALEKHVKQKWGISLKQFEQRQEDLYHAEGSDPKRAASMREKWNITEKEQGVYKSEGTAYLWQKRQAEEDKEMPETEERNVGDSVKSDLMKAMTQHGESVTNSGVDESYTSEDNSCDRQSDVANAFEQVEHEEIINEMNGVNNG